MQERSIWKDDHLHLIHPSPRVCQNRLVIQLVALDDAVAVRVGRRLPGHLQRLGSERRASHVARWHAGNYEQRRVHLREATREDERKRDRRRPLKVDNHRLPRSA